MEYAQSNNEIETLAQAREKLARQEEKIKQLQQLLVREEFAQKLRQFLISSAATNVILLPFTRSHLLEMIVSTAADVISARAGSLFLIEEMTQELFFEVAIGPVAQTIKKYRVPVGHGIVGLVVATGQAIAIANVQENEHFAKEIASSVNYLPENILCVPLFYDGRIIGAVELLDKIDRSTFNQVDIKMLGYFANIAAVAIMQSQAYTDQQTILTQLLRAFGKNNPEQEEQIKQDASTFVNWLHEEDRGDMLNTRALHLASLVQELIQSGTQECELCITILQGLVRNIRQHSLLARSIL